MHLHGLPEYQFFTAASQLAALAIEQALGERFVEFYGGTIPLTTKNGNAEAKQVSLFSELREHLQRTNCHLAVIGVERFTASPKQLFAWARTQGLLDGQRSRHREAALIKLRNSAAHPERHLVTPIDSGRSIRLLGELINRLWGESTCSTGSYPGPIDREVLLFIRSRDQSTSIGPLAAFDLAEVPMETRCWIILAVRSDRELHRLDPAIENTLFPVSVLAGPCSPAEASSWLAENEYLANRVNWIDRIFYLRVTGSVVDPPRNQRQAIDLDETSGEWHLVKADFPADAWAHTKNIADASNDSNERCKPSGPCPACSAETVQIGSFSIVLKHQ